MKFFRKPKSNEIHHHKTSMAKSLVHQAGGTQEILMNLFLFQHHVPESRMAITVGFSRYIDFDMHLDIRCVWIRCKKLCI
jgi:hypothetical protein